jgi:ankyrin repeat protein
MYAGYKAIPEEPQKLQVVTALLKAGADALIESPPKDGSILSLVALRAEGPGRTAFLKAVLDGGVNPNVEEYYKAGEPYLFRFANQDTPDSLKLMVERGANVNARDSLGKSALYYAISTFSLDEVNYLLDHGADPKVVDKQGVSFASYVHDMVLRQKDDPLKRYPKILALQDRLIRAGVPWPPLSPKEMRKKLGIPDVQW